jgi:hypothetical protein
MNNKNYWQTIEADLDKLAKDGIVKLPSLEHFNLDSISTGIINEMRGNTFMELSNQHKNFLNILGVHDHLTPRLFDLAQNKFNFKGPISNQYHIARRVDPGNSKELYRAHFDSHLFTVVFPIKIPKSLSGGPCGDLIYFPKARNSPKSELRNAVSKIYHKRYASEQGIQEFSKHHQVQYDDFSDYRPLLFRGNTTLHTNKGVSFDCSSERLTLLAHFFDPSPKYGVGSLVRFIRNR